MKKTTKTTTTARESLTACRDGVWCVRHAPLADGRTMWDLLTDPRSRTAVEVAERFAAGDAAEEAAVTAAVAAAGNAAGAAAWDAARSVAGAAQAKALRRLVGANPFLDE